MPAYASNARDLNSPTAPFSANTSGTIYIISSNTTTATTDPWQTTRTATYSNVTYISPAPKPEPDWAALRYEARRAASMVPPPRENRAQERRHLKVRKGFHQMCRLPCYRGARPR